MGISSKRGTDPRRQSYYDIDSGDDNHNVNVDTTNKLIIATTTKSTPVATTTSASKPGVADQSSVISGFVFKQKRKLAEPAVGTIQSNIIQQTSNNTKKQRLSQLNKKESTPTPSLWSTLTPPYNTTTVSQYGTRIVDISNILDNDDTINIVDAIKSCTQHELQHIEQLYNHDTQYIIDSIQYITQHTNIQYNQLMSQQSQLHQQSTHKQNTLSNLEQLIDCDITQWFHALTSYGTKSNNHNSTTNNTIQSIDDPADNTIIQQTHDNFAIKGDSILNKLRHIYNTLLDSEKHTTHVLKQVNAINTQLYSTIDSKQLIQSLTGNIDENFII